jgi:uroporphyrin-3 C-methyltransferase
MNDEIVRVPPVKHKPHLVIWLIVLTLFTLSSTGYTLFSFWKKQSEASLETARLSDRLHEVQQNQLNSDQQLQTTQTAQSDAITQMHSQLSALQIQVQSAIHPSTEVSNHWLLLKAQYAIELAQLNAYWSADRKTTIALLKQADGYLALHQEAQLFSTRQALARDISAQETTPVVDQAGLLSQLDALQQEITTQPFKQATSLLQSHHASALQKTPPTSWQGRVHATLGVLKQFFVVRYHPDPLQPLLTPAYKALQRETLRLNIQEAQWAILQHNDAIYQHALKQALHNMQRAFGKDNVNTQSIMNRLQQLKTITVQDKPIIPEESLITLNQVIHASQPEASQP